MKIICFVILFGIYICDGQSRNYVRFDTQEIGSNSLSKEAFQSAKYLVYEKGEEKGDTVINASFIISVQGVERDINCNVLYGIPPPVIYHALQSGICRVVIIKKVEEKYVRNVSYILIKD
jgi:hypothetical protein